MTYLFRLMIPVVLLLSLSSAAQPDLSRYNLTWTRPGQNAGESMPCGGGDIGLNVWVENGDLLFYMSRSGTFDENNGFLKLGRMRIKLTPDPWAKAEKFCQTLKLEQGYVEILGELDFQPVKVDVWVDVFHPVIHVDIQSRKPVSLEVIYESWRNEDRVLTDGANQSNRSFLGAPVKAVVRKDVVGFHGQDVLAYHRNDSQSPNAFDLCIEQQGLSSVKDRIWNPITNRTFGVLVRGQSLKPAGRTKGQYASTEYEGWRLKSKSAVLSHKVAIYTHVDQAESLSQWKEDLMQLAETYEACEDHRTLTQDWWKQFWQRSYIVINDKQEKTTPWTLGRNYQLFRYQQACNAYGQWPTKFNGGLFTVDPEFTEGKQKYSPDFRRWGGGSFTAQNQRLVYWPMLKSGDADMMRPQFEFYRRTLKAAELRSQVYWGHRGACYTEQIENFGLPVAFEYGWKRPDTYDPGLQYNAWLEYHWDTALEFCWMILEMHRFTDQDISAYLPMIESCLVFFDERYQALNRQRSNSPLDPNGHLVLYPSTAGETYKMAANPAPVIAALQVVITRLLSLPDGLITEDQRAYFTDYLKRIPPLPIRQREGVPTLAPAGRYERIQNVELPQLYPAFPYGLYGIGRSDLEIAINTWKYGADREGQKDYISWHQDAIFCARLGLTEEAAAKTVRKLGDSGRRCPTFWGPGHDWVPDHNWGGSGMIGLQEMLMQTVDDKIYLMPAWPKEWDVIFKLHAPGKTVVQGKMQQGKVVDLQVAPSSRRKDVIVLNGGR
ncbi:MAG: hypothetical protein JW920_08955 [Deltaproteobacteria bacterium]|nr:hypothetical protein [Deltaproteobacteria bacterium]